MNILSQRITSIVKSLRLSPNAGLRLRRESFNDEGFIAAPMNDMGAESHAKYPISIPPVCGIRSITEKPLGQFPPANHPGKSYADRQTLYSIFELLGVVFILALSACASTVPVPEIIHTRTYIPAPATLTAPITVTLPPDATWGSGLADYAQGLRSCNAQLDAIRSLKPPPKP